MKNSKDNLEDLFRNLFNDSSKNRLPEGWNMPSEDDWDSIQEGFSSEKKEEKKFLYWHWVATAASILLLLSVFQLYQSNQKIEQLSKKVIENDQAVQQMQADLQTLNEKKIEEIKYPESKGKQSNLSKHNQATSDLFISSNKKSIIKATSAFNNNIISKSTRTSPNVLLGEATFKTNIALIPIDNKNSQHKGLNTSSLQKEKTLSTIFTPDNLSDAIPPLDLKNRTIDWVGSTITPVIKNRPRFYVAANYTPVLTTIKNNGVELGKNESAPRREIQKTAFSTGLHFGIKWNKGWSLETGLNYSTINKLISHNRIVSYKSLKERLNGNGDYESEVNLELGYSEGVVNTDISLARNSSSTVKSDAKINMNISFTNDRDFLEVPIIVRKEWGIGSFALSLKAGLLNRFLLTKSFELQKVTLDDTRFNFTTNNFREQSTSKPNSSYSTHYLAGFGLEYAFQPECSFYVEPTFIRRIQPVIGSKGGSTYPQSKIINIGLRYLL